MLSEYQKLVLNTYKKMREAGGPSLILSKPTTAKLKKECLRIYDKRYTPEDDDILSTFFNVDKIGIDFRKIISSADTGVFRPLLNHLKNDSIKTNERNSELLAWLIDFKPRPSFKYYRIIREGQKEEGETVVEEDPQTESTNGDKRDFNGTNKPLTTEKHEAETSNQPQETTDKLKDTPTTPVVLINGEARANEGDVDIKNTSESTNTSKDIQSTAPRNSLKGSSRRRWSTKKIIISSAIMAVIGSGIFLFWKDKIDRETITKDEKCMYWTGNRYEAIACDQETSTPKTTLNIQKLKDLKRITTPDKLTKDDLGKVWYAKIQGKVEFYTDSGTHPIDTNRVLSPLTGYMLSKYISYDRYLLNCVGWGIGIIVFSIIFVFLVFRYLPKKTQKKAM